MNVVLIDQMGIVREMAVERLPVRIAVQPVGWLGGVQVTDTFGPPEIVEFRDSGMVDGREWPVLTPDGKDVPLGKFWRSVFRRGRKAWADVQLTDAQVQFYRASKNEMVVSAAEPTFRALTPHPMLILETFEVEHDEGRQVTTYRVLAEERIPVSAEVAHG